VGVTTFKEWYPFRDEVSLMSAMRSCPGTAALRDLLGDRLARDDAAAIRAHVEVCGRCRRVAEALAAEALAAEAEAHEETGTFEPVSGTEMITTAVVAHVPRPGGRRRRGVEAVDLSFLAPAGRPNSLGRIGRYEVLGRLGKGGMGIVLKAQDGRLGRAVAVKVLAPALATSSQARRRFLREARAAAAINHAHVVTVHEVGTHRRLPFLVMEYIRGRTLRHRIREGPPPTPGEVVRVAAQVAAGLTAAHEQGIIHRDINPANIMLEGRVERVKITDFGLARVALGLSELSSCDRVLGTPAYMSPEQVSGGVLDARSDLFALGAVLYAMLAGRSPFHGSHPVAIVRRVCDEHPRPPEELNPSCPPELSAIIMRLLAKAPADRFPSATALTEALRPLLAKANQADSSETNLPVADGPPPRKAPPALAVAAAAEAEAELELEVEPPMRHRALAGALALAMSAVVLLAAAVLVLVLPRLLEPPPAPEPDPPRRPAPPQLLVDRPPGVLTIARAGRGDHATRADALAHARSGDTLRILDGGTNEGPFALNDPVRFADLTIEAAPGVRPTLAARDSEEVVRVVGVPGVTLRGLAIRPATQQFAVRVSGEVPGLTLADLRVAKPPGAPWAHVYLAEGARGTPERPIRIEGSRFEGGHQGLVLQGTIARPVAHVRVLDNLFLGLDQHLELLQGIRDVLVADNRFARDGAALWVNLPAGAGEDLRIEHNTMLDVEQWLGTAESAPAQGLILVRNNAILGQTASAADLLEAFTEHWTFVGNLREHGPDGPDARAARFLAVLSRDPNHPDFLRPAPGSALLGPDPVVGARPPRPEPDPSPPATEAPRR
jgi:hypothetical protein